MVRGDTDFLIPTMAEILKRANPGGESAEGEPAGLCGAGLPRPAQCDSDAARPCGLHGLRQSVLRPPFPRTDSLQTTAMDQVSTVMNADDNVVEGLRVICEKNAPEIIGLPTTGLETQGTDIRRLVKRVRELHPQFENRRGAGEYAGLQRLPGNRFRAWRSNPRSTCWCPNPARRAAQETGQCAGVVDADAGDIEAIKEWIEAFGLRPVVLPDIGDSLDGHLVIRKARRSRSAARRAARRDPGESVATPVVGRSLHRAADLLLARTHVPERRFDHLWASMPG